MAWFLRRARDGQAGEIETTIGRATTLSGDLKVDGGLRIDGRFEGTLEVGGNVIVGEHGRVISDIDARHVTVGGAVRGNIRASGRLEILSTGQVHGDILASQVMIDEGGILQGMSLMGEAGKPALAAPSGAAGRPEAAGSSRVEDDASIEAEPRVEDAGIIEVRAQVVEHADAPVAADPSADAPVAADPSADAPSEPAAAVVDAPSATADAAPVAAGADEASEFARPRSAKRVGGLGRGLDLDVAALDIEPVIPDLSSPRSNGATNSARDGKVTRPRRGNARNGSRGGKRR